MGAGCTGASLVATVTVSPSLKSTCVRVVALAGGAEITSQLVAAPGTTDPLLVAIFEPQGRERPVTLVARGYVGNGCQEPLLLNDESPTVTADFKSGPGGTAELVLEAPPPELDADRDGYRTANAGGPDCDDRRSSVRPDISEVCGDGVDNNCDGKADCEEAFCIGQPCGGGRVCTQAGACEGRETLCANAVDDDLDGLIDCLDLDCLNVACDDGDLCSTGDRCVGGQCAGMPVACSSPGGNACLSSSGTCNPADGGCVYPALAGQGCGGSNVCDHDGGCGPLYPYTPSNFTPPAATAFAPLRFECGGTVTLDTTPGAATVWGGGTALCGQVPPLPIDRPQTGAGTVALIPVQQLVVASGTDLVVSGSRPVIFAVFGDAQIDGRLWFS
ncbi:MAG TPA: putative metal-binding motif-containing protein, partial [Myxococcales bacterium]|nr:putative metal-binding motif-containing protein [Myxococcales bacterium]